MTRAAIIIAIIVAAAVTTSYAGFKMYAPGQEEPIMVYEGPDDRLDWKPQTRPQPQPATRTGPVYKNTPADNVDMSGVEWRQSRGHYSGRGTKEMTKKFGYSAGTYRLEYDYKARRYFGIWMNTRRGLRKLIVNRVGRADTHVDVILPKDDEVWFEVESPFGNWEFTFERIR